MAFAAQLLAGSGYSPQKRSFGQLVGEAMQAGQQAKAQSQDSAIRKQYMESQMEAMRRPPARKPIAVVGPDGKPVLEDEQNSIGKTPYISPGLNDDGLGNFNPGDYTPDSFAKYIKTGISTATRDPSVLIRYETPREQNPYFRDVTRINPDGSTQQGVFNTRTGTYQWPNPTVAPGLEAEVDAAAQVRGAAQGSIDKKRIVAGNVLSLLDQAEPLIDSATGSTVGQLRDKGAAVFGKSTGGAESIAQLKVIQAGLMMSQPRMEGPQSDKDTQLYREAAGSLGDPSVPSGVKKKALQIIRQINEKYADINPRALNTNKDGMTLYDRPSGGWSAVKNPGESSGWGAVRVK